MEQAVRNLNFDVTFPYMRMYVEDSLESLSDPAYQREKWGVCVEGVSFYDDLTLNTHILYDDCAVLPSPQIKVPAILYETEVPPLLALEEVFGPLLDELGNAPDEVYLDDPRWADVVAAARAAYQTMLANDEEARTESGTPPSS